MFTVAEFDFEFFIRDEGRFFRRTTYQNINLEILNTFESELIFFHQNYYWQNHHFVILTNIYIIVSLYHLITTRKVDIGHLTLLYH